MSSKCLSINRFMTRYAVREEFKNAKGETETAIVLSTKKTVCNDSEQFKYYAKIGGLLNLQDLTTQRVQELISKLDVYGYYLIMANFRTFKGSNSYGILVPHFNGRALGEVISPLVSFIPRINGRTGEVICALRISSNEKTKDRQWTRYVGSTKSNANGFHELKFGYNYDNDYKQSTKTKFVGFYVTKNASLVLYDIGTADPNKAIFPEQNRTLVQEGGFVYADAELLFRQCDENTDKLLTAKELYENLKDKEKSFLGTDKYKRTHLIRDKEPKKRSVIFFLKTNPLLLPYELHITDDSSKDPLFKGKRIVILCIPSAGEVEYCEYWEVNDGIKSVQSRQNKKPWLKYLQLTSDAQNQLFEEKINDIPLMSYPTEVKFEKTPQSEDIYKKIKTARKGGAAEKKKSTDPKAKTVDKPTESPAEDTNKKPPESPDSPKETPKTNESSGENAAKSPSEPTTTSSTPEDKPKE